MALLGSGDVWLADGIEMLTGWLMLVLVIHMSPSPLAPQFLAAGAAAAFAKQLLKVRPPVGCEWFEAPGESCAHPVAAAPPKSMKAKVLLSA